jgi:hypothetical protein
LFCSPLVRRIAAVAGLALFTGSATAPPARAEPDACENMAGLAMLASPHKPWKGAALRVMLTLDEAAPGELTLVGPGGQAAASTRERRGGPPYFWYAEVAAPAAGKWQLKLAREGTACPLLTREITVAKSNPGAIGETGKTVWPIRGTWNRATENLYSAWVEKLFDAPLEESLSWPALHEVLRDKSRNALFNHLGAKEDEKNQTIKPDCADLPYFLRAYFAFKMGLPFGYAKCSRGGASSAPRCPQWWHIAKEEPAPQSQSPAPAKKSGVLDIFDAPQPKSDKPLPRPPGLTNGFGFYLRNVVANGVHSGSGRTALTDDSTDYYPVALDQSTLRPGTIYADPYGHILVLVKRVAQTDGAAGVFLAVDGQPDGTVARKRFWRGNFLFATDPGVGGPGFKRFRPVVAEKGGLRRLSNSEIAKNANYGDFSLDQSKLSVEEFYDRMDDVMSPAPLDPKRAMLEAITSLEEQVKTRVTSVENGRKHQVTGGAATMPDGASIFETTGAWEDFATPSRDLRLLIAIDVVRGFPERVSRRPERYAMPSGKSAAEVKADLDATLAQELSSRSFSYTRTDGSPWTLTIKDVVERAPALEMAYNVNDCAELRWGAPEKSDEAATCKGKAPEAQRAKMTKYRTWFAERRRPARGVE